MDEPTAPPRYRVEHRHPDLSPLIVAFARSEHVGRARLAVARARLLRRWERGTVVLVDQATETDLMARSLLP